MAIQTEEDQGTWTVRVSGEVDLYSSPEMRKAVVEEVPASADVLAVDLEQVAYMDSSGVATLVEGLRESSSQNRRFVLLRPSPPVRKVLELSRLDMVFDIEEGDE